MNISNRINRPLVVIAFLAAGQILGAASGEGRRIDTFSTDSQEVPSAIGALQISYLSNSKLDRLRVFLRQNDQSVTRSTGPRCEYDEATDPIAFDPIKKVLIAQILNANPFSATVNPQSKYKYFVDRKWLMKCVNEAGFAELAEGQASDLRLINEQNERNLSDACRSLPIPQDCSEHPTPSESEDVLLAEKFGEIRFPTSSELKARHISHQLGNNGTACSLQ